MSWPAEPPNSCPLAADPDVHGMVPSGLSGQLVGIGRDGVVHSVHVRDSRVSYSGRRIRTEAVVHNLVAFGGSLLAFGDGSPAYELSIDAGTLRRVDLAGRVRPLAAYPKHDPATGELHLIAHDADSVQAHVVVSAGALTRHSCPVTGTSNPIQDLALSRDHAVFLADGFVGVAAREGESRTTWITTGVTAPHPVHAYDAGDTVIMLALTPSLERWTLQPGDSSIRREVLDPTPRHFAHYRLDGVDVPPSLLWTTGDGTIGCHDLAGSRHVHHDLRPDVPGDLVFVADATRRSDAAGGWLVGFVHDTSTATTELRVIDPADLAGPPIATVRIPQHVPHGIRCTWIPTGGQCPQPRSPSTKENRP